MHNEKQYKTHTLSHIRARVKWSPAVVSNKAASLVCVGDGRDGWLHEMIWGLRRGTEEDMKEGEAVIEEKGKRRGKRRKGVEGEEGI